MNLSDLHPLVLAGAGLTALVIIVALPVFGVLLILAKRWDRKEAERLAAGALAAPYGDLSVITPADDAYGLILVHRDQPRITLGTVTAVPSGFLARYGTETPTTYPAAEEAAYALAARHVELQPKKNLERRLTQTHADELAKFKASPRG